MAKKNEKVLELTEIEFKTITFRIVGDGDIVLNKMNDVSKYQLTTEEKLPKNYGFDQKWRKIITSVHWKTPLEQLPIEEYTEELYKKMLTENLPCITGFGLKKSWCQAVVRNGIDTYSTKFDAGINVVEDLIPIAFAEAYVDDKLMSPKKGSPVQTFLNRFGGWSADITIRYVENIYTLKQIMDIINLAGFGLGIGSGRTSGYGRYHIEGIVNDK